MTCCFILACSTRALLTRVLVGTLLVFALGCSGSSAPTEDTKRLVNLVSEVADGISTKQGVAEIFSTGAAVPQKKAEQEQYYSKRFWTTKKDIRVNGDTAAIAVHVETQTGDPVGEVEWTAVRESGRWKLRSIPLP